MAIQAVDAQGIFTKELAAVYKEMTPAPGLLRSFFPSNLNASLFVSVMVKRGHEKIAPQVMRGTGANRVTMEKSSERMVEPPHYHQEFNGNELDFYDQLFGTLTGTITVSAMDRWLTSAAEKLIKLQQTIERSYELQAAQVLQSGIVNMRFGENIDFRRKAASIADVTGIGTTGNVYWGNSSADAIAHLKHAINFIREEGKTSADVYQGIFGDGALTALFTLLGDKIRTDYPLTQINSPVRNSLGGSYHGRLSVGSYSLDIWSYPEVYDDESGNAVPYIDSNKVAVLPPRPEFSLEHAAVPQVFADRSRAEYQEYIGNQPAEYVIGNYIDKKRKAHFFDIASSGITLPTAIDQMATLQVLA